MRTDKGTYVEPTLPVWGPAGSTLRCPTFQQLMLRVTDATNQPNNDADVRGALLVYPYISAFNANSSRLCLITNPTGTYKRATIYQFNPTDFTCSASGTLLASALANNVQEFWMLWSGLDPKKLFALVNSGYAIYETDVETDTTTLVKSLTGLGHTGGSCQQMSLSEDDDVFAGTLQTSGGQNDGYWAYKRSTDTVLKVVTGLTPGDINEVQIDKSGRYLGVIFGDATCEMWDLQGTPTLVADRTSLAAGAGLAWSHYDAHFGTLFTKYWDSTVIRNIGYRNCATPTTLTPLLTDGDITPGTSNQDEYYSLRSNRDDGLWGMMARWSQNNTGVNVPLENEIFLVATDGSQRLQRLCHHRVAFVSYYDAPFASQSRCGRFIAFTSNWGATGGRHDVYIVRTGQADPIRPSYLTHPRPSLRKGLRA